MFVKGLRAYPREILYGIGQYTILPNRSCSRFIGGGVAPPEGRRGQGRPKYRRLDTEGT
jgi:hypothetical protein